MSYAAGPRVAPLISEENVYSLGAEGDLLCLSVADGKVKWSHNFKKDYNIKTPMWGWAGHPILVGKNLICLAGGQGTTGFGATP